MRVLAVAQDFGAVEGQLQPGREDGRRGRGFGRLGFGAVVEAGQPVGDHAVVAGGVVKAFCQGEAGGQPGPPPFAFISASSGA